MSCSGKRDSKIGIEIDFVSAVVLSSAVLNVMTHSTVLRVFLNIRDPVQIVRKKFFVAVSRFVTNAKH